MTVEYILILLFVISLGFKGLIGVPVRAFKDSAPKLASRVEKQLITGDGFNAKAKGQWKDAVIKPK